MIFDLRSAIFDCPASQHVSVGPEQAVQPHAATANSAPDAGLSTRAASNRKSKIENRKLLALTLVEALISMVIVSTMLVAALNCVGAARSSEVRLTEHERALALAQGLMTEILRQAYVDPAAGPGAFGIGSDELTGNRSLFDDVDDYDGWDANPPQNKDGSTIPNCADYEQVVAVAWVDPTDLQTAVGSETGVKRIRVTIKHSGRVVVTLTAYRTEQWPNPAKWAGAVWP